MTARQRGSPSKVEQMDRRRIVIVGAGSAMFTQGLANPILTQEPRALGLVAIDPQAPQTAEGLSRPPRG